MFFIRSRARGIRVIVVALWLTGFMTLITVPLAVIPFSPFVSSIGLLTQTGDYTRRSFIYGSVICLLVALVPALTRLFCSIPLPVSSAVMLVSWSPAFTLFRAGV
ncbi:solute carrier family 23 protein [Escherichia coli]